MDSLKELLSGIELRPNKRDDEPQRELTYAESHRAAILNEIEKALPYDAEEVLKTFDNDINNIPLKDGHADIETIEKSLDADQQLNVSAMIKNDSSPER